MANYAETNWPTCQTYGPHFDLFDLIKDEKALEM